MGWSGRSGAIAAIVGLAIFTAGPGIAWADPTGTDSHDTSVSRSETSSDTGAETEPDDAPTSSVGAQRTETAPEISSSTKTRDDEAPATPDEPKPAEPEPSEPSEPSEPAEPAEPAEPSEPAEPQAEEPESPEEDSPATPTDEPVSVPAVASTKAADTSTVATVDTAPKPVVTTAIEVEESAAPARLSMVTSAVTASDTPVTATVRTAAVEATVVTPEPISPIAEIAALPGRIVNAVLQVLGFTTSASAGQSPFSPAPIADLIFAVFRRIEEIVGLHAPVVLPVPPAMVYEGPLDIPTPTVKQFLDAATTEYVLGATPGGMVPFTVNGWPLTSLHLETGSDASVWVTPQGQIIIAYSGTTGGTNLLVNPLIAITQIITDLEAGLGSTTPLAFTQALSFAEAVKVQAALQGYSTDDVFVTGHSLGAWQAQYVAQQIGLNGIGFEGPGLNTVVPGNGANSLFVNTATYGDMAGFLASDLPGLSPLAPPYVPGGGLKPHYGPIVLLGDPNANTPMVNAARLFGQGPIATLISAIDLLGNFFAKHLPGVQAYHLDVDQDPGVVPWLGINEGPVYTGFGEMTIPEFLKAASDAGILVRP